jgi:glycosyltransferase involved in cell wall biosynthesis/GT2 family glycosyltransferase
MTRGQVAHPVSNVDWSAPDASVVVPTFNRSASLVRLLHALESQESCTTRGRNFTFEVIVVSDGSTDDTSRLVDEFARHTSMSLSFVEQVNAGPGAARNRGVDLAQGRVIVFLDDDVVPAHDCVAAHMTRHDEAHDVVVIGPMLTPNGAHLRPWVAWEQRQLEKQYRWFGSNGPAASHVHFYTGNASVDRSAFTAAGGFDPQFKRAEDVELAYRLAHGGQSFVIDLEACVDHHADRSFSSWQDTAESYGRNIVRFARMGRNEYWEQLERDFGNRHAALRWLIETVLPHRRLRMAVARGCTHLAIGLHRIGLTQPSFVALSAVYALRYYEGAAVELGSTAALFGALNRREQSEGTSVTLFVLEQTLGHVTHAKNLEALIPRADRTPALFLPISADLGRTNKLPVLSNWTIRAGLCARAALRGAMSAEPGRTARVLFVHTQVPAVLLGRWMRRYPTIISIDATPRQYDSLGESYAHSVGSPLVERLKRWANVRCFDRAAHIVAWSTWAKQGLIDDYGVEASQITVIPPGVDCERWSPADAHRDGGAPLRALFVGGDLRRKGGDLLIRAARRLRSDPDVPPFEVHLVTGSQVECEPGVVVHHGLTANSDELIEQYRRADVFCLPTRGDCLPMVLAEAAAMELPLIATDVGAISEIVRQGDTGCLVPAGDIDELTYALRLLLTDSDARRSMGRRARELALAEHDARRNAGRIARLLDDVAAPD